MVMTPMGGLVLLLGFGLAMFGLTALVSRSEIWWRSRGGFLYAGRRVGGVVAGLSIAASWIWAPALFVSVQKSYELGLAGLFWFTAPNVLAVVMFAYLGPKIRQRIPGGFSIPDWIRHRFSDENPRLGKTAHVLYLIPYFWYQIMAVTVQIFVGGLIFNYLTGLSLNVAMAVLLITTLSYSLLSGMRASIVTDAVQMIAILVGLAIVLPWLISVAGSDRILAGLAGTRGSTNVFDPTIAFSFGIVTSIGLLSGAICDQQFWQRVFSIRPNSLVSAFIIGGIAFAVVPLALSSLGFIAAAPGSGVVPPSGTELPMIGIATILTYLPISAAIIFVIMLLCGLASTLDSGFSAAASLYAIDVKNSGGRTSSELAADREATTPDGGHLDPAQQVRVVRDGRLAMIVLAVVGYGTAVVVKEYFPLDRLWWLFNGVATMFVVPTILSIFWDRLSARGVIAAIIVSTVFMAGFVYGNFIADDNIVVFSALGIVLGSLAMCLTFRTSAAR